MGKLVREHMHCQCRHADICLAAVNALLGGLRVEAAMCLLVPRQIRGCSILLAALGACKLGPIWLGGLLVGHSGTIVVASASLGTTVGYEEGLVGVGDSLVTGGTVVRNRTELQ